MSANNDLANIFSEKQVEQEEIDNSLSRNLKAIKNEYENKHQAMNDEHKNKLKAMNDEHENKLKAMNDEHENKLKAMNDEHKNKLKAMNDEHENNFKFMNNDYDNKRSKFITEHLTVSLKENMTRLLFNYNNEQQLDENNSIFELEDYTGLGIGGVRYKYFMNALEKDSNLFVFFQSLTNSDLLIKIYYLDAYVNSDDYKFLTQNIILTNKTMNRIISYCGICEKDGNPVFCFVMC